MYVETKVMSNPAIIMTANEIKMLSMNSVLSMLPTSDCAQNIDRESIPIAINDDKSPINMPWARNGLRMKRPVAPTSFMVCIRNLLAYMLKRTVLLISA